MEISFCLSYMLLISFLFCLLILFIIYLLCSGEIKTKLMVKFLNLWSILKFKWCFERSVLLQDYYCYSVTKLCLTLCDSCVWLFVTPWTAICEASQSFTTSQSWLKLMSIELVISSNHLILCCPLLLFFPLRSLLYVGFIL